MMIYDLVHLGEKEAKKAIRSHFYEHANVKDQRVIDMLVEKGYIDLEDTLLQHKQKTHLMYLLEGQIGTHQNIKVLSADASDDEKFVRWVD
jgi:NADH dehydrogenase (ubiquinone) 1 alpha subcomplex subunit 6